MTHRLILAAYNEYFYQLLVNTAEADQETAVILMPDHSCQDVVNMVQQLYNFKVFIIYGVFTYMTLLFIAGE